jgi:hypothetical protein
LASSNSVKVYDRIVQWTIEDSTSVVAATSSLAWYSTTPGAAVPGGVPPATGSYWWVQTITVIPAVAQATGTFIDILNRDSSGPILFRALYGVDPEIQSQTYDPPLKCQPLWLSTAQVSFTTGAKVIFHLA